MSEKNIKQKTITTIIIFMLSIVIIFPFLVMVSTSLKTTNEISGATFSLVPQSFRIGNYFEAMQRGDWGFYFANSTFVTVFSVIGSLFINSTCGYALARINFKGRDTLFKLFLVGLMIPPQAIILQTFLIMKNLPLLGGNDLLGMGGTGLINTRTGLIVPLIAGSFGVFLCRQFYVTFPKELDEATRIDGLGRFGTYIKIYLPLSGPILATLAVFKATSSWNDYLWPLIITNSEKLFTVQLALTNFRTEMSVEWHLLMAATTLIVLPLIAVFLSLQKYYVEGIVSSGIKG